MPMSAQQHPPQILEIHRDFLKPGSEAEFRQVEEDAARICRELKCPHPYVALETLAGPREVWWLNGYESEAEVKQVAAAYTANTPLMAALKRILERKKDLILEPVEVFTHYRADLSSGAAWSVSPGRFVVITRTTSGRKIDGTVFVTAESPLSNSSAPFKVKGDSSDRVRFIVTAAGTRGEADAKAARAGAETHLFAVRPYWSMPAKEWVAADPEFWREGRGR